MFSITLGGADELAGRLDGLPAAIVAAVAAKSAALADQLLSLARQKAGGGVLQSRSGALAASIEVDGPTVAGDSVSTRLLAGGNLKYAAIQEFGGVTAPHEILPERGRALTFLAGGGEVFAKVVHHPGSHLPERSYLRASLTEMAAAIDSGLKAAAIDAARQQMGA